MYTSMLTQIGMYAVYFHKVQSRQVAFSELTVAMLRANEYDNDLIVKIAASELPKKTVEVTN